MLVLLVEDEQKIAYAIKRGLEQEHYAVDVAYDGKEGLSLALSHNYDLILLDRMLPGGLDGSDICREVRAKGIRTPILLLTALDGLRDKVSGLDSGADDYLVKPFAFEELLARLRSLLRRPEPLQSNVLLVENLSLDTSTYEVKRAGKIISVTSKEYSLLEYLMRHPGRIISKEAIISHVWDYDADILPNTVEVYIGYLRNKIDKPFALPPLLQTVRGFGYRLGTA